MTIEERHMMEICLESINLIPYDRRFLLDLQKKDQKRKSRPLTHKQEFYLKQIYMQHSNRI